MKTPKLKFANALLKLSLGYYAITMMLIYFLLTAEASNGLFPFLALLIFLGGSFVVITILTIIKNKTWLNEEHGRTSKYLLLSYLVVPLIILLLFQIL
jgi:hypothetical protein